MNDDAYDDAFLEKEIKARFRTNLEISEMIARRIPAGPAIWATIFLSNDKTIYAFIEGTKTMTLGEVKRLVGRMGLRPDRYFTPYAEDDYFNKRAEGKFKERFPGKPIAAESDLTYYKSLVPYSPALVSILEIMDGKVYQYDNDAASNWRPIMKVSIR